MNELLIVHPSKNSQLLIKNLENCQEGLDMLTRFVNYDCFSTVLTVWSIERTSPSMPMQCVSHRQLCAQHAQWNNYLEWNGSTVLIHVTNNSWCIVHRWHLWRCLRLLNHYNHLGCSCWKMVLGIDIAPLGHLTQGMLSQVQNLMLSEETLHGLQILMRIW